MDLRQFQYIMKVVETGNITKAADALYMTQPALSRFIAKVEKDEGIRIFDRSTNPISLTFEGDRYVDAVRRMLEIEAGLREELAAISGHRKGKLVIGIPPARAAGMLPAFLPEFVRQNPGVNVHTVEHNSRQLREDVLKGAVDFAILPLTEPLDGYRCEPLYEEELFLVTPKGMLGEGDWQAGQGDIPVVRMEALDGRPFILLKHGHGIRSALDVLFNCHGVKPAVSMETTNNETAFGLAAAGLGMAIVPEMCLDFQKRLKPIDVFRLSDSGLTWTVTAILPPEAPERYFVSRCIEVIRAGRCARG